MSGIRKQAHPERDAPSATGTSSGSWSFATPPAWRVEEETRAPATLVEATFHATADAGSIPAVSIATREPARPAAVLLHHERQGALRSTARHGALATGHLYRAVEAKRQPQDVLAGLLR